MMESEDPAPDDNETPADIATVDAAGQTVASRLREAEKQLSIVLDAIDDREESNV